MSQMDLISSFNQILPEVTLRGEAHTFTIEKYLGEGHTSKVFLACMDQSEQKAALKVLRPDAADYTKDNFWNEAFVLGQMQNASIAYVPKLLDQFKLSRLEKEGKENGIYPLEFIATEYVDSKIYHPLDSLLQEGPLSKGSGKWEGEEEALELARQALELLEQLHIQVRRTYTDMQIKNFCWDQEHRQLKVIDWNHVSQQYPVDAEADEQQEFETLKQRDLARLAAYLYKTFTGKGASEQGESSKELESRAEMQWPQISAASRRILQQALHPTPKRRYPDVTAFLKAVQDAQRWLHWQGDERALGREIKDFLDKVESIRDEGTNEEFVQYMVEAEIRIDVLERRGIATAGRYKERLDKLSPLRSAQWMRGQYYYNVEQYGQAAQEWTEEVKAQKSLELWRRLSVARVLAEIKQQAPDQSPLLKQMQLDLEEGAQYLEENAADKALECFDRVYNDSPLSLQERCLHSDAEFSILFEQIRSATGVELYQLNEEEWKNRRKVYAEIQNRLSELPYQEIWRTEKGWDGFAATDKELEKWINNREAVNKECPYLSDLLSAPDLSDQFEKVKNGIEKNLRRDNGNPKLLDLILRFVEKVLEETQLDSMLVSES